MPNKIIRIFRKKQTSSKQPIQLISGTVKKLNRKKDSLPTVNFVENISQ
jgi:hypothetical protein